MLRKSKKRKKHTYQTTQGKIPAPVQLFGAANTNHSLFPLRTADARGKWHCTVVCHRAKTHVNQHERHCNFHSGHTGTRGEVAVATGKNVESTRVSTARCAHVSVRMYRDALETPHVHVSGVCV